MQLNLKHTGANFIKLAAVECSRNAGFPAWKGRTDMRLKLPVWLAAIALMLLGTMAWADQIVLRDGTVYSGKFIRGDAKTVDFRVLGRVESFKIEEIAQIIFKEPELGTSPTPRVTPPAAVPAQTAQAPAQPVQAAPPAPEPEARLQTTRREVSPQNSSAVTLPVSTPLTIRTTADIDTDRNRVGDVFEATLENPLVSGNQTVAARGATVKGRIAYAKESGKLTGQSQLVLELTDLVINGKSYMLRTSDYTEVGSSRGKRTAATVGGTAALGTIIGAIAGGGKGAAIGAASGAAVGTGVQVVTRGQVLKIPAETILEFRLEAPLTIDAP